MPRDVDKWKKIRRGSTEQGRPDVGPGTVLSESYALIEEIGRGGFGTIFRARQLNIDREVAVKVLPSKFHQMADVAERFEREAKLASRLQHPNTITIHDFGQHDKLLYIVMELLKGQDLADILRAQGSIAPTRALHIAKQVLHSLSEAHSLGIVHRDLKPENIFLTTIGDDADFVKVLDFGIAKLATPELYGEQGDGTERQRKLTVVGSTVGTPAYMSPEQAAGEEVNRQTDLYALGAMLFEMIGGKPPFDDDDPVKTMRAHLFRDVPPLNAPSLRGTLLDRVIRKALEKDPTDRFDTANDFLLAVAGDTIAQPMQREQRDDGAPQDDGRERTTTSTIRETEFDPEEEDSTHMEGESSRSSTIPFLKSQSPDSNSNEENGHRITERGLGVERQAHDSPNPNTSAIFQIIQESEGEEEESEEVEQSDEILVLTYRKENQKPRSRKASFDGPLEARVIKESGEKAPAEGSQKDPSSVEKPSMPEDRRWSDSGEDSEELSIEPASGRKNALWALAGIVIIAIAVVLMILFDVL